MRKRLLALLLAVAAPQLAAAMPLSTKLNQAAKAYRQRVETADAARELVQLRHDDSGFPKVQPQAPLEPGDDGRTWLDEAVEDAEAMVRSEEFVAKRNDGCARCEVRGLCPIQPEGREIV